MISFARRRSRRNSLQVRKNTTKMNARIPQVSERRCRMPLQYGIPKISGLKLAERQTLAQQSPALQAMPNIRLSIANHVPSREKKYLKRN